MNRGETMLTLVPLDCDGDPSGPARAVPGRIVDLDLSPAPRSRWRRLLSRFRSWRARRACARSRKKLPKSFEVELTLCENPSEEILEMFR